jgi:DNA-binding MurR/RpiR family transcriptional regulator
VVDAVEIARSFGATTIALTRPGTPLAGKAEIVIGITIPEADDILRPTPSRYAHMAIVDTIATGLAARLGAKGRDSLRRVRYALTRVGVALPTPTMDPTPLMKETVQGD